MTPTFDPARAESYVRSFQKASEMTGYGCCTADEEQAASEAFMAWARSLGLRGKFFRTLTNGGSVCWVVQLDAGRGKYELTLANPLKWATAVEAFGLPMDDIPAVWQGEWAEKTLAG